MQLSKLLRSATFRLSTLYAGLFAASVVALGAVVFVITRDALESQLSARIESEIDSLRDEYRRGGIDRTRAAIEERQMGRPYSSLDYALIDAKGRVLAGDLQGAPAVAGWHDVVGPGDDDEAEDEKEYERIRVEVLGPGLLLAVGDDLERVEAAGNAILSAFAWSLGLTIALAVGGGLLLARGFLSRIEAITRTAEAIISGNLGRRVPLRGGSDDLDHLAATLNRMLDRIAVLMDSLKQVSNDIAHDLRTPLARLHLDLERVRDSDLSGEQYKHAIDNALAELERALRVFSALLRIAEIESGKRRASFRNVDVSAVAATVADAFVPSAEEERKKIELRIDRAVEVCGDRDLLMQMIANLIENALRHTESGTTIHVSVEAAGEDHGPRIVVADDGPGVPDGDREKVMQRFYRLERSRTTPGTGLGLSLVAAIAQLHDATVRLSDNRPGLHAAVEFAH